MKGGGGGVIAKFYCWTQRKGKKSLVNLFRTFECVKKKYEEKYEDKMVVFGKEFAFYVSPRENYRYIPRGYRHSFLIR